MSKSGKILVPHFNPPNPKGGGGGCDVIKVWETFMWTLCARLVSIYDISLHSLNIALYVHVHVSGTELHSDIQTDK